jgi:DNA-binding transcriptional MerR regulator
MRLKKTYSSREVAALTGLTARQLQLWDAGGLLSPTIPSRKTDAGGYTERRYTPIELFELLVLADLRRQGRTVAELRRLLTTLRDQFRVRLFETIGGGGPLTLLTDGDDIYGRTDEGALFNLLRDPQQPMLMLTEVEGLRELSPRAVRTRKKKRPAPSGVSAPRPQK